MSKILIVGECIQPDIIWRGDEQEFTSKQLEEIKMLGDDYHGIVRMFVPDLDSYLKGTKYVVHHIDGNHDNQDPTNLVLMLNSTHVMLHWEQLSPEEYIARNEKNSQSNIETWANMSLSDKKAHSEVTKQGMENMTLEAKLSMNGGKSKRNIDRWANMSPEEYEAECETFSKAQLRPEVQEARSKSLLENKKNIMANKFLKCQSELFTVNQFGEATGYAQPQCAMHRLVDEKKINCTGEGWPRLYESLICEEL